MNTKQLAVYKKQATIAEQKVREIKIKSQKDLEQAKEVKAKIWQALKLVKNKRDEIIKPLRQSIKKTQELFEPILGQLEYADRELKNKMEAYLEKLEAEKEKKEKEIAKKVEKGEMKFETAGKKLEKIGQKTKVVKTRTIKEVIIEKPELVPSDYWIIDEVRVRADVLAGKDIPGVVVREKKIVIN